MCLGVPGKVLEVNGYTALVDFWGTKRKVRLETVDAPVQPGDYVLVHVGYAIRRIPQEEVEETLRFYEELIKLAEQDMMGQDIRTEIGAGVPVEPEDES